MSFYFQNKLRRVRAARANKEWGLEPEMDHPNIEACIRCHYIGIDDALLLGSLAATAAGTGMSIAGNAKAQSAMNAARTSAVRKEQEFQREGNQVFNKSLGSSGADTAKNTAAAGAAQRENAFKSLSQVAQPIAGAPLPANQNPNPVVTTDNPVEQANAQAKTRGNAFTTLTSNAQANEGGLEDWQASQNLKNAEANRQLGVIGNEAHGTAALLPLEMQVAGAKGDALSGWGQLFSALGSVAGTAGAVGVGRAAPLGSPSAAQFSALDAGQGPLDATRASQVAPYTRAINFENAISPWSNYDFASLY